MAFEQDGSLDIESNGEHLSLRLLTIDLYNKHIHSNVPARFLDSGRHLRQYYVATIQNPYEEGLN